MNKFFLKLNLKFCMKNVGLFVTFYMNLHTRSRSRLRNTGCMGITIPVPVPVMHVILLCQLKTGLVCFLLLNLYDKAVFLIRMRKVNIIP
jgi:hypothetical protein